MLFRLYYYAMQTTLCEIYLPKQFKTNQMKTLVKTALLFSSILIFSISTFANTPKKLKPIHKSSVELNLTQFCNYLENGNPHNVEGVYTSPDKRYVIALVKNDKTEHDFIGVVLAADNQYWKEGEVKFNFVLSDSNELKGFYYNSKGNYIPVDFTISSDTLKTNSLHKLDIEEVRTSSLAYFSVGN